MRLVERRPALSADELAARLSPPRRFAEVRFETYVPDPAHPSQAAALAAMRRFASDVAGDGAPAGRRTPWRRRAAAPAGPPARYLDGGYGVGKTHLLASLWHAAPAPKAYLTFAELTAVIGVMGMDGAIATFRRYRLLCIDEFELDDVANTLMAVTFLRAVVAAGVRVATTSNALPDRLGEGRFHAADFVREIAAIAGHFEVVRIDGPDYRKAHEVRADALSPEQVEALRTGQRTSVDDFDDLLAHLRLVHTAQFGALLDGLDTVVVTGMHPIGNQGDALLFVHLVDEIYDAEVTFAATGCRVDELFPASYRHGGYRKKYGRCESRLSTLLAGARAAA